MKDNSTSLKLELHLDRAGVQLPEGLSQGHSKDQSWTLHMEEYPSSPQLCVPLLTQPRGHPTSPLFLPWQSRTKATADFAAQEAPTAKPSSGSALEDSVGTEVPLLLTCQT